MSHQDVNMFATTKAFDSDFSFTSSISTLQTTVLRQVPCYVVLLFTSSDDLQDWYHPLNKLQAPLAQNGELPIGYGTDVQETLMFSLAEEIREETGFIKGLSQMNTSSSDVHFELTMLGTRVRGRPSMASR